MNAHIGLKRTDISFLKEINETGRSVLLVLNKADRVKDDDELRKTVFESRLAVRDMENVLPQIHVVSCDTGFGVRELGTYLATHFLITGEEELYQAKLRQLSSKTNLLLE